MINKGNFIFVDFLKGLAILGVVMVHIIKNIPEIPFLKFLPLIISVGGRGPQLFFILSGFLTYLSLSKNSSIIRFYKRRLSRIWPLFALSILIYIVVSLITRRVSFNGLDILHIISLLTLTFGLVPKYLNSLFSIEWFIGTLVTMYLISPLLFRYIKSFNHAMVVFFINVFCIEFFRSNIHAISPIEDMNLWKFYVGFSLPSQLPFFILGFALYFLLNDETNNKFSLMSLISSILFFLYSAIYLDAMYVTGVSLLYLIYISAKYLTKNYFISIVSLFGKHSLYIYIFHLLYSGFIEHALFKIGVSVQSQYHDIILFTLTIITLLVSPIFIERLVTAFQIRPRQ